MPQWPLGVFTSIDSGRGVHLEVAHELGVPTIQLHAPAPQTRTKANAEQFLARLQELGITLTAVFGGFAGESYADIPTVARTVGLVPRETRTARLAEMKEIVDFARLLGCDVVALHLGCILHEDGTDYQEVLSVTRNLCDHCRQNGQRLHLETGQEPADAMLGFILNVARDNLFINFDPANMILYGSGDPIDALEIVGQYVKSVHCKDAKWAQRPGLEWGQEMPLGQGDVGMENFLRMLDKIGYTGPLTIEREIPQDASRQQAEIGGALQLLTDLKRKLGAE